MSIEPIPAIGRGRCGCAADDCNCDVQSSSSVTVTGAGSAGDPYLLTITDPDLGLDFLDTATVDLSKCGSGTFASPFDLTGTATTAPVQIDEFTTDDTYAVPATASMLSIKAVGCGGGGGGGQVSATGGRGGGGGAGGNIVEFLIPTSLLGPTLTIEIPFPPAGGNGGASGGGGGTDGVEALPTKVLDGAIVICNAPAGIAGESGGGGGAGGVNDTDAAPYIGGRGATSVVSGSSLAAGNECLSPTGGGAGASHTGAGVVIPATDGGDALCIGEDGGVAPGGAGDPYTGGAGGGVGSAGGDGGVYGGGGGGGGGQVTGVSAGGAGGDVGPGYVRIVAW
jgi:hypothetical protein